VKAAEAELKAETAEIEKKEGFATRQDRRRRQASCRVARETQMAFGRASPRSGWAHYERIAKARKTGLSEARDSKCLTCQMTLRPQVFCGSAGLVEVEGSEAVLTLKVYGSFTVGAETDNGNTKLELDLAEIPNVPKDFKDN